MTLSYRFVLVYLLTVCSAGCGDLRTDVELLSLGEPIEFSKGTAIEWVSAEQLPDRLMVYRFVPVDATDINHAPIQVAIDHGLVKDSFIAASIKQLDTSAVGYKGESDYESLYFAPRWTAGSLYLRNARAFERDDRGHPMPPKLPSDDEAYSLAIEWMKRLGFDENLFFVETNGTPRLQHQIGYSRVGYLDRDSRERVWVYLSKTLLFRRQVNGYAAFNDGVGGSLSLHFVGDGELARAIWSVRPVKEYQDLPLLTREQVVQALHRGYGQIIVPMPQYDALHIESAEVLYYEKMDHRTTDWCIPILSLTCSLSSGDSEDEILHVFLPALRIHHPWLQSAAGSN